MVLATHDLPPIDPTNRGALVKRGPAQSHVARDRKGPAGQRLQRVLADAGVAARRACETLIENGRVTVNGEVVRRLPVFVDPARDRIAVDGRVIDPRRAHARPVYLMLHKPTRTLCVNADEPGADRATIFDLVHMEQMEQAPRLFAVGRLEYDATGLVLLTNDGDLANLLTHPRYGVPKVYHALVKGTPDDAELAKLEKQVYKDQVKTKRRDGVVKGSRVEIRVLERGEGKSLLEITLREGRNPQVGRVLSEAGWPVRKLAQVALGPLELKGIAPGRYRELDRHELAALRRLAKELGSRGGPAEPGGSRGNHGDRRRSSEPARSVRRPRADNARGRTSPNNAPSGPARGPRPPR